MNTSQFIPRSAICTAVILIGLLWAGIPDIAQSAEPKYGGTLRFVGEVDARGFDAIRARSAVGSAQRIGNLVMETLFKRAKNGDLIPVLGLSATCSQDGKLWSIKLRKGVTFHDGTPFTADAVVSHWERLLNPENRYRGRIFLSPIEGVEKSGNYTVRFILKHAWLPFTAFLTSPAGFTALIPSPTAVATGVHNRAPVGTGPFVFKEWQSGGRIVVTRNPNYWQKGKPFLDRVVCWAISDHDSRYAALVSGQADMMITDRPSHVRRLNKDSEFATYPLVWRGAGILVLNNTKPPLNDRRVRRALALAWDQKKYIRASFEDIMPYTEHWYGDAIGCTDANYPSPNIDRARTLIAEYGKPVELEYIHTATTRGREAGAIIQQMFNRIGVKVMPVPSDIPGIMRQLSGNTFDITSWVIPGAYDMSPVTFAILHSKSPFNVSRYRDPQMDQLLHRQMECTDPKARAKMMCTIARKVNADTPFLYLFGRTYYLFARKRVKNVSLPVRGEEGLQLADIWIDR